MISKMEVEKHLVLQAQKGDINAFEKIYRHFQGSLFLFAKRRLLSADDAAEAVQITFVKLHKNLEQFNFQSKFSSYLYQILINVCNDMQRSKAKIQTESVKEWTLTQNPNPDLKMQLEEALRKLPDRMQTCFTLFAVEGFSQDEIASILSLEVGTVKAHIFKARQKLQKIFMG